MHSKLCSLTASLEHLASRLEHLRAQTVALDQLSSRTASLEIKPTTNIRSIHRATLSRPQGPNDHSPTAATALMQYFGFSTTDTLGTQGISLSQQIEARTSETLAKAMENVDEILRASERAAGRRLAAMEDVADALSVSPHSCSDSGREVRALEERINAARAELERG